MQVVRGERTNGESNGERIERTRETGAATREERKKGGKTSVRDKAVADEQQMDDGASRNYE